MDANTKALLAAHKKTKRERTTLLKDLYPTDLLILIDRAEERGEISYPVQYPDHLAYLSRATPEQVQALASRLPYAWTFLRGYPRGRFVVLFARSHLVNVLSFALTKPGKYIKVPRYPGVGLDELSHGLFADSNYCECDQADDGLCGPCQRLRERVLKGDLLKCEEDVSELQSSKVGMSHLPRSRRRPHR